MTDQLSMLPDLDRASDTRKPKLCRSWKNAIMNDCGVFTVNRMDFEAHEKKRTIPNVEIHCAMEYPRVYVSFSLMGMSAGGGSFPERDGEYVLVVFTKDSLIENFEYPYEIKPTEFVPNYSGVVAWVPMGEFFNAIDKELGR